MLNFGNDQPELMKEDIKEEVNEPENIKSELDFDEFIGLIKGKLLV